MLTQEWDLLLSQSHLKIVECLDPIDVLALSLTSRSIFQVAGKHASSKFLWGMTNETSYKYHNPCRMFVTADEHLNLHLMTSITRLTFGHDFDKTIDNWPPLLTHLTFGMWFDQPVDNLPQSLTYLSFGTHKYGRTHLTAFNQPINNLPQSLTHLCLGVVFNQLVDNLPQSLTHLYIGHDFNQPVDHLPQSLTWLKFTGRFNHLLENLPQSLTHLILGRSFNSPLDHLPHSITHLCLGERFKNPLNTLPQSLTFLLFQAWAYDGPFSCAIPQSLKVIVTPAVYDYGHLFSHLPKSITITSNINSYYFLIFLSGCNWDQR